MCPNTLMVDGFALVGRIRLLLVDRDPVERSRLRSTLEPRFLVVEAADVEQAVKQLDEGLFEAILTEYDLGEHRTGVWLLEYALANREQTRRALMSSTWVPELEDLEKRGVVWLFKLKPLDPVNFSAYFADPWTK